MISNGTETYGIRKKNGQQNDKNNAGGKDASQSNADMTQTDDKTYIKNQEEKNVGRRNGAFLSKEDIDDDDDEEEEASEFYENIEISAGKLNIDSLFNQFLTNGNFMVIGKSLKPIFEIYSFKQMEYFFNQLEPSSI